jgi:hypothetical protein
MLDRVTRRALLLTSTDSDDVSGLGQGGALGSKRRALRAHVSKL